MKKRIQFLACLLLTVVILSGCGVQVGKDFYSLPKRSKQFAQLQSAIDSSMYGLTYSSPKSGENQQTVQMADLDGDGVNEYLVFAKSAKNNPLQVLIFKQGEDGTVRNMEIIGTNGLEFEQVEYVEIDDKPGMELVIGQQVSDQVLRSVAVYSFSSGKAELLLLNSYSRFITCDLDSDGKGELMVLRPGESEQQRGMAVLYSCQDGQINRSVETELSVDPSQIRRITPGKLQDGSPAVFVASSADENAIVTDVFARKDGRFTNISFSHVTNTTVYTMRNYYLYANDVDNDGIMELPSLITMKPLSQKAVQEQNYLLRWFSLNADGIETDKLITYHNFSGGWYMQLDSAWAGRISVEEKRGTYRFCVWDEDYRKSTLLFSICELTGSNRDEDAVADGRFALYRAEGIAYAGKLEDAAAQLDITEDFLKHNFHLIRQEWKTGES